MKDTWVFFHFLAIINRAAMNIVEHVSLLYVGASFGYMPRSGIAASSDVRGRTEGAEGVCNPIGGTTI